MTGLRGRGSLGRSQTFTVTSLKRPGPRLTASRAMELPASKSITLASFASAGRAQPGTAMASGAPGPNVLERLAAGCACASEPRSGAVRAQPMKVRVSECIEDPPVFHSPYWLAELWRGRWRSHQLLSSSILQQRAFSRPAELGSTQRGGQQKLLFVHRLRIGIEVRSEKLQLALRDPRRLNNGNDRPRVLRPLPQLDSCNLELPLTHVDGELSL